MDLFRHLRNKRLKLEPGVFKEQLLKGDPGVPEKPYPIWSTYSDVSCDITSENWLMFFSRITVDDEPQCQAKILGE